MKTILTLDKADQPFGFPQLNSGGTFDNVIATNITGTTISAATYLNLPNQNYIADTYSNLSTLRSNSGLTPGVLYKITDRSDNLGIFINAVSTSEFSREGYRFMYVPLTYESTSLSGFTWVGVWNPNLTPSVGDLCIWGARVWENVNGNTGSQLDQITLDTEWVESPFSTPNRYIIRGFEINYDFDSDWIYSQTDGSNYIGNMSYSAWNDSYGLPWNPCDRTDWGYPSLFFINNKALYFLNNSLKVFRNNTVKNEIYFNYNTGGITNNNSDYIVGNSAPLDSIVYNNVGSINFNSNNGSIQENTGVGIYNNSNSGDIRLNYVHIIQGNSNAGDIQKNEGDEILDNTNNGGIINNYVKNITINNNNGGIGFNLGYEIYSNNNDGSIGYNHTTSVLSNSNPGIISNNRVSRIVGNTNNGNITQNLSNGEINTTTSATTNIIQNIFNGDLDTSITGPISGLCCTSSIITTGITSSAATLNLYTNYYGVNFNGNVDLILPNPTGKDGYELHIKDEGGYAGSTRIRLTASTGLIDGNSYVDMNINYMSLHLIARNNNWWII